MVSKTKSDGFEIDLGGEAPEPAEQNSRFKALPAGPKVVSIFDAEIGEYGPKSVNAGRPNLKVQFRIEDGQEGANRRQFETIPLFQTWSSGKEALPFLAFFAAVQGKTLKEFREEITTARETGAKFSVPKPQELLGRRVVAIFQVEKDEYGYTKAVEEETIEAGETIDDFTRNSVRYGGYKAYDGILPKSAVNVDKPKVAAVDL